MYKRQVYARADGESGMVPAKKVDVIDTTGAGDAFFAGTEMCIRDRMKGDKVVELLKKGANLLLFGIILRHR